MKKKTTYYPPVERVTLPQFAKRKTHNAGPAGQISMVGRKQHESEPRNELREEILREFSRGARKLAR